MLGGARGSVRLGVVDRGDDAEDVDRHVDLTRDSRHFDWRQAAGVVLAVGGSAHAQAAGPATMPKQSITLSAARAMIDAAMSHAETLGLQEVIVVDSFSTDGTIELIKAELRHPQLKIMAHPPGLYQSWNHGIALPDIAEGRGPSECG